MLNGATLTGNLSSALGSRLAPFERDLGLWVLTDPSSAPLQEFDQLTARFTPRRLYRAAAVPDSSDWRRLSNNLTRSGVAPAYLSDGQRFELGQGAGLEVLLQTEQGAALYIGWQNFCLLVPGGVPPADVLARTPRHNWTGCALLLGKTDLAQAGSLESWLTLAPRLLLSSATSDSSPNSLNSPQRGWIELKTDGQQLWLQSER